MPAFAFSRQPDALSWFGTAAGLPLLEAEHPVIASLVASRPAQPWLWLAPVAGYADATAAELASQGRGLCLHRAGEGLAGPLRCALPLPLATEAVGTLIVQHVHEEGDGELLEECARLLEPGGRLWLFTLNPWSPYRLRWRKAGLVPGDARGWHARLRAVGLHPVDGQVRCLGPIWKPGSIGENTGPWLLRSVQVLEAEKRVPARIPPSSLRRQWRTGAAAV